MSRVRPDARKRAEMVYKPVDMIADMLGGLVASWIVRKVWSVVRPGDDAPRPTDEQRSWREILLAAGLYGTISALIKAVVDRSTAEGTRKLTGTWPGEDGQQPGTSA
jgi:hypothetical protein